MRGGRLLLIHRLRYSRVFFVVFELVMDRGGGDLGEGMMREEGRE